MDTCVMKKLPIGIEHFDEMRTEDFYYIDKTGMIADLLNNWGKVNLFTRPRRFGKSLNMSMLKCFFEINGDSHIFHGLAISKEQRLCEKYMGKYPVISISLKEAGGASFQTACALLSEEIRREASRFQFLLDSENLSAYDKQYYKAVLNMEHTAALPEHLLICSLALLSRLLHKHYAKKVIILIDEYDVPLAKASEQGYYEQMLSLIRYMLGQGLKTNESLHFAVLTGCLRIAKESIFTGLNNLKVLSVSDVRFDEYFGFSDREVRELLAYYKLSSAYETIRDWYDGYRFGNTDVYCPWDVINYCDELRADLDAQPSDYWSNTSGNDVIRHFIQKSSTGTAKREIESLIAGETVEKEIRKELTYRDLYASFDNLWSVLYAAGYLTCRNKPRGDIFPLVIPNMEIRRIFTRQIMDIFREDLEKDGAGVRAFCDALKNGDAKKAEAQFQTYLRKTISIRDTFVRKQLKESFYHGILLGLLACRDNWGISSNKESGDGYSDIFIEIEEEETGIIIEIKYAQDGDLEKSCQKALDQIETNHYEDQLREDGFFRILKYGIACYKKRCRFEVSRYYLQPHILESCQNQIGCE